MLETRVGLEAEFLLLNKKGEVIIPPAYMDRDAFPILGEIRGDPGESMPETVSDFLKARLIAERRGPKSNTLVMEDVKRVQLAVYKEAMKQVTQAKGEQMGKVKNIYGVNIDDFSDQIVKKGKIQGINISCGLHIHFSCDAVNKKYYLSENEKEVSFPVTVDGTRIDTVKLYKKLGHKHEHEVAARASILSRPVVEWIVKEMDEAFFERFAPAKKYRTKYRQPGFFELKPYGFEYRSLPANEKTMGALPEITEKAFELLGSLNKWD